MTSVNELGRSWDAAADGYDDYWVPRFRPWNELAVAAVVDRAAALPPGPVLVPCCGPGQELEPLARGTGREVVGFDLSEAMVGRARARAAGTPGVTVEVADAQSLSPRFPRRAAALVSCFGLQQMPAPEAAIEDWARTLAPGGVLSVIFWPRGDDDDALTRSIRRLAQSLSSPVDASWQERVAAAVARGGAKIVEDRRVEHTMHHPSASALWDAYVGGGSMSLLARRHGQAALDALKPRFVAEAGEGPLEQVSAARFILAVAR